MQFIFILEQVLNGLLSGVYYLLIALGLSLIFSLGGIVNLAHGAFYAIGAYLTVVLSRHIGLAMVAEQGMRMIFGASPLPYAMPDFLRGQLFLGDFIYPKNRLVMLVIASVAVTLTWLLIYRTPFGRVVRAGVQDPEMVGALGISLEPYMMAIAAIGVGLAGLAGALLASIVTIHPAMGQEILTAAFVVVVIGGLGSFWGVVAAALLVGVVRGVTIYFEPAASEASMYLLMVLVLLFRPRGLFGERIQKFE